MSQSLLYSIISFSFFFGFGLDAVNVSQSRFPNDAQTITVSNAYSPKSQTPCNLENFTCFSIKSALEISTTLTLTIGIHKSEIASVLFSDVTLTGTLDSSGTPRTQKYITEEGAVSISTGSTVFETLTFLIDYSQRVLPPFSASEDSSLTFNNVNIEKSSKPFSLNEPLIRSSGIVLINNLMVKNIVLNNVPVIGPDLQSLTLESSSFVNIQRSRNDGSVLSFNSTSPIIIVNNTLFDNCDCKYKGFGGAIYFNLTTSPSLSFENVTFTKDCSAKYARFMFVAEEEAGLFPQDVWDEILSANPAYSNSSYFLKMTPNDALPERVVFYTGPNSLAFMFRMIILGTTAFTACVLFIVALCKRPHPYPEELSSYSLLTHVQLLLSIFKFRSLLSFSFLPDSIFFLSLSDLHLEWLRPLLEFGSSIFKYISSRAEFILTVVSSCILISFSLFVFFFSPLGPIASGNDTDHNYFVNTIGFFSYLICDVLFEDILSWSFPSLYCLTYDISDDIFAHSFPTSYPKDCTSTIYRAINIIFSLEYVLFTLIYLYYHSHTLSTHFFPTTFTLVQNVMLFITVYFQLFVEARPIYGYLVSIGSELIIALYCIRLYYFGNQTIERRINLIYYIASVLSLLLSIFAELIPSAGVVFTSISLALVLASIVFAAIVLFFGWHRRIDLFKVLFHRIQSGSLSVFFSLVCCAPKDFRFQYSEDEEEKKGECRPSHTFQKYIT